MADERADLDRSTLVAVALAAYALVNLAHEGLGHGGACLLAGGEPQALDAIYFECGDEGLSGAGRRLVAAGGTLVNLVLGAVGALALRHAPRGWRRYALWLFTSLNLFQATGYWLFSGLGGIGDWAVVTRDLAPAAVARVGLTLLGLLGYSAAVLLALKGLSGMLGPQPSALPRARVLALVPYLAGGALFVGAGLLNPLSPALVLVSAAAASFGAASALAWMTDLLRDSARFPRGPRDEALPRSQPALVVGALAAALFVALGRGLRL